MMPGGFVPGVVLGMLLMGCLVGLYLLIQMFKATLKGIGELSEKDDI